jgi:flagellar basal body-associated protein FliL
MAEIHVQQKKDNTSTWLWILISLVVVAALAFVLIWNNYNKRNAGTAQVQTSSVQYHSLPAA